MQKNNTCSDMIYQKSSVDAQKKLSQFIKCHHIENFISLGQNCSTAWYLKELKLKKSSYPFDWVFSSPEIIIDCIENKFQTFLDKSFIYQKNGNRAGHNRYHGNFFNHRNPLHSDEDYQYYKRCCSRFITLLGSETKNCFLITLINEPKKRPGWANGFNNSFKIPQEQSYDTLLPLINLITSINNQSVFVIIDHYTEQTPSVAFNNISENVCFITFTASGASTGVYYKNQEDDCNFKTMLSGLAL